NGEERLLGSDDYQEQIAEAIYNGLRNYFMQHPLQSGARGAGRAPPPPPAPAPAPCSPSAYRESISRWPLICR
ncbi:hypothetical protein QX235_08305, partial [Klebsiella pneumoniae]|nr:hypothetical protein [Klebsiella pneumoniae]